MSAYVIFGGVWGTGLVGIAKLILIYISVMLGGAIAISDVGGFDYLFLFSQIPLFQPIGKRSLDRFGIRLFFDTRVLSSQTYIQAVLSGKTLKESRTGSLISAFLIPPIGIAGIFIGLFMRINYPNINPASAFPQFVLKYMNPWLSGIVLATLLIAAVGTGAGLALGISTVFTKDIYKNYIDKEADDDKLLMVSRLIIVASLSLALCLQLEVPSLSFLNGALCLWA